MIAAMIATAIGGTYRSGEWSRCRCPVHQSFGATLALRDGLRGLIVHCHTGCSADDVLAKLRRRGLLDRVGERGFGINGTGYRSREEDPERIRLCLPYPEALR